MQEMNYRFSVWNAVGGFLRTFSKDESFVLSAGLRLQVTPEGDAREGSFRAKGSGILIPSLSAVQIEYRDLQFWRPIFYGQIRQGGNPRDTDGENYILRSLGLKLQAVTLSAGFVAPKQPAHLTVRAIIQDVIASGQLGSPSLIQYSKGGTVFDTIPDLPFDCREIKASNQQIAGALLDQIVQDAAGLGVEVRWGVGPDREFYFREANTGSLILGADDFSRVTWKAPVAETPCTAVLWFVARKPDGTWLTHKSIAPAAAEYGQWVKPLTIESSVAPFETVPFLTAEKGVLGGTTTALDAQDIAYLTDKVPRGGIGSVAVFIDNVAENDRPYVRWTTGRDVDRVVISGSANNGRSVAAEFGGEARAMFSDSGVGLLQFDAVIYDLGSSAQSRAGQLLASVAAGGGQALANVQLNTFEFRPERINTALLDSLAKYHYQMPAQEPAEIPLKVYVNPQDLTGRVEFGDYSRAVDAWEYRISAARGLEKVALTGQADDPAKLAQAALIKANDGKAVITAVTASR